MKYLLFIFLAIFIISCANHGEDSIKVNLNTLYDDPGRGFFILYPMTEMEDSLRKKITFPNLAEVSDTTFAQIYFTGTNHSTIENGILVLVADYSTESPLFWIDYNNDLIFSANKEPLVFSEEFIDISIPNIDDDALFHIIRFHKPDSAQKDQTKQMIEEYITRGKTYADFFFDERRNIKVGDFVYRQDSITIGIMDYNVNGKYNDLHSDRIVIGEYGGEIYGTEEASGAVVLDSITYFHGINYGFEVIEVADNGTSISIRPTLSSNIEKRIEEGQTISDYTFALVSGEETSIHDFLDGQKFLYLNFWASWCGGCHQEMDDLNRIHVNHPDKVTIVSLNYNEDIEKIEPFLEKYQVSWLSGFSTSEINEELFIYGLPRNILMDSSGKIIEMNIHPSDLINQMDQL